MFGICLLHCAGGFGGYHSIWLSYILGSCVDGFVFISGYYGLRFAPSKVIRLIGVVIIAGLIAWGFGIFLGIVPLSVVYLIKSFIYDGCNWYVYAYLALMFLAPMVDAALNATPSRKLPIILFPLWGLTFVWSYGLEVPFIRSWLPTTIGLGSSFSFIMMLNVYTVARLCRRFNIGQWITPRLICFCIPLLWIITSIGFGRYNSPFAIGLATIMFFVFLRVHISEKIVPIIFLLGPSMFAVYLLHLNSTGIVMIRQGVTFFVEGYGLSPYLAYLLCAVLIFVGCILLDIPRRLIVRWTVPVWKPLLMRIDAVYARIVGDV